MTITDEVTTALDADEVFSQWFTDFSAALRARDTAALDTLLVEDCWWRDMVALDWHLSTHRGRADVARLVSSSPNAVVSAEIDRDLGPMLTEAAPGTEWIDGFYRLSTETLRGRGHVRLVKDTDGQWRAWTVLTAGEELLERPLGVRHRRPFPSGHASEERWHDRRARLTSFERPDPEVLVVGGAQNGLGMATILGLMGIDTLVVDKSARVGDVWRERYESLVLHAPVYSDHLPHFPFPENWPKYTPARKWADWLEAYAKAMELNVWNSTEVVSATFDATDDRWTVVTRGPEGERTVRPSQLVVATGTSSVPWEPELAGRDQFRGSVIHSDDHETGRGWDGRKVVVVGAGTSAHDVAEDFVLGGADVTMVQRSPVYVMSRDLGNKLLFETAYNEDSPRLDFSDLQADSIPWPLLLEMAVPQTKAIAELDKDLLEGLEKAGFATCLGDPVMGPEAGMMSMGCRPGGPGGYYINVGASELIIEGKIAVRSGVGLERFEEDHVVLSDGSTVQADLVVLATGYLDMREASRTFLGDEVVDQTEAMYGLHPTLQERGLIHQPSGHPNLWYAGGGVIEVRRYSKYLALQVAATLDGHTKEKA